MTATTLTQERIIPLTLSDRCDQCGAQAFFRAVFASGELTFCGHHGRELKGLLQREALLVEDSSDRINLKPSASTDAD